MLGKWAVAVLVSILILGTISVEAPPASGQAEFDQNESGTDAQIDSSKLAKISLPFIENQGQLDQEVRFYANTFAGTVFVTEDGLTYALMNGASEEDESTQGVAVKERFLSEQSLRATGFDKSDAIVNYFVGEKDRWRSNIPTYLAVNLGEVWSGVDVELRAHGNNVEKIFNVKPGANVGDIRLAFEGVGSLKVSEDGELLLETELGTLVMTKPFAFQSIDGVQSSVDVSYFVQGNTYGFEVGSYDPRYTLIIDPLLGSTFIGGSTTDFVNAIALDNSGNVFVAGEVRSSGYPTTTGAFDTSFGGFADVFVSKLDSGLTSLLASTFIGGSDADIAHAIALDSSGNVFIAGQAGSGYPTTGGAFDTSFNGGGDVFVSKLNNGLTSLLVSTFIGGSNFERANAIVLDSSGNVFVAGQAESGYPTAGSPFDASFNGGFGDVFVSKLDSGLTSLLVSTFIGGSGTDFARAITLDSSGNVFVAGDAESGYPTAGSPFDSSFNGNGDIFISKLDSGLTSLLASTFIGGSGFEFAFAIALDSSGNVFVAGETVTGYPTTTGAFDETHNGGRDVFVSKLDSGLTSLLASTFIGGNSPDGGFAMVLDSSGNVFVAGRVLSTNYPITTGAFQETYGGGAWDGFVSKLNNGLTSLLASTFIGGSGADEAFAMVLDSSGNVFVAGFADSGFPTTTGAFDETHNGSRDAFVSHITNDLGLVSPEELGPILEEVQKIEEKLDGDRPSLITIIVDGINSIIDILLNPEFGLEEIKLEVIEIQNTLDNTEERVSETVSFHDNYKLGKEGTVLVLLDTTGSGKLSVVHVAANLPCNDDSDPTDGPDTPDVVIRAGVAGMDLVDVPLVDTGFVGPDKTCIFHGTLTADLTDDGITDVIAINTGPDDVALDNSIITITGTYE